jgi:prevent-host-death family protein
MTDGNHKGNVAEAAVVFHAARLGIPVFRPLAEHGRYDLVLELGGRLLRVQCKWAPRHGDVVTVRLVTNRRGPAGFVRTHYAAGEIDAVAAYCPNTDECYLLPAELVVDRTQLHLRLVPARNGQRASLHFASAYLLGAVAQLGERRLGRAEATGSSPVSSTPGGQGEKSTETVGAHIFRNHFGWYMERAAAGDRFLVTRRGKPYVRLIPTVEQLGLRSRDP